MILEDLKLKLRDELWIMKENKPTRLYVEGIIEKKQLDYKIDYGQTYDTVEKTFYEYQLTDYLGYKKDRFIVMFTDLKVSWFRSKNELINSL